MFDIVGTIASGWLTDRVDSRLLLAWYYGLRGLSLFALPFLFARLAAADDAAVHRLLRPGLGRHRAADRALCRELFGTEGTMVFGWIFASHQVGAAFAASAAGLLRTELGSYDVAWIGAGALCLVAAGLSVLLHRVPAAAAGRVERGTVAGGASQRCDGRGPGRRSGWWADPSGGQQLASRSGRPSSRFAAQVAHSGPTRLPVPL